MNIVAIIPARGGSKGIPGKNIIDFCGKPLINWTIEAALGSNIITRTIVSTDDMKIASVSGECGAEVIMRPDALSGDISSSEVALLHVLEELKSKENYQPDLVVFLQCTSPLTIPEDIDGTIRALLEKKADTALAVTDFHYYLWEENNNEVLGINHDKSVRLMRQEKEPQYLETGAVYVMNYSGFINYKHRFFGKTVIYKTPPERCFEIDDAHDLIIAESIFKNNN
ncbi:acylneuraminate cytidylyltransferase family protein [Lentisphaera profundi]|uniref:Acylneuraminate cytidylyltransferase family protein n=1 Tax=Lentisphaera profundi TaxID=1658616 RepID=A0ABY7VPA3_9BACT|nr:acylneuraminate cytidylyltransferase family protein [Lentisphaera profundi]WDE95975.1 acylneuraminate cytidylyltransferase family protein [Lentisphaera profundi]